MRGLSILLLSGLLWVLLATTARSQEGTSLYEPFPEPSSVARAERFVDELRVSGSRGRALDISRDQLEEGVVVDAGTVRAARTVGGNASERAGSGEGLAPSFGWPLATVLLVLAGLAATLIARLGAPSRAA